jgi:hypothetical protein
MAQKPSHEDGHLVVAAIRVLCHKAAKPPTPEDVANLLDLPADFVRNVVVALGALGVLHVIENPFETRAELGDHILLEDLPRASESPSIKDELDSFVMRKKKEAEDTEKMFTPDEIEKKKKEKIAKLNQEMKRMKKKGYKPFPE